MLRWLVVSTCLLLVLPASAHACSCVLPDLDRDLPKADAAIVGEVVWSDRERPAPYRDWKPGVPAWHALVRVERVVKGPVNPWFANVGSFGYGGGDCGLEVRVGDRVGLLLRGTPGEWTSSLCAMVDPDELAAADGGGGANPARVLADVGLTFVDLVRDGCLARGR